MLAGLLDLITWLDLANLPRRVALVDLVAWLGLISLVDLVSRNQALALGSVLRGDLFSSSRERALSQADCQAVELCDNVKIEKLVMIQKRSVQGFKLQEARAPKCLM